MLVSKNPKAFWNNEELLPLAESFVGNKEKCVEVLCNTDRFILH